jgi:hypothetical protein
MAAPAFGDTFVPELRKILDSISTATSFDEDGREIETREQPFTYPWQLTWMGYDPNLGRSRVICKLVADGKSVTAVIDAGDFGKIRANNSRSNPGTGQRITTTWPYWHRP